MHHHHLGGGDILPVARISIRYSTRWLNDGGSADVCHCGATTKLCCGGGAKLKKIWHRG